MRRTNPAGAGLGLAAAVVALAGCMAPADRDGPRASGPASSGPSMRSATPTAAAGPVDERAAVEAAYRQFWVVSWQLDRHPKARWRQVLSAVAADPELTRVLEGTRAQQRRGITRYGQVASRPSAVTVNGTTARVRDCQGADRSGQADARTGRRLTVGVPRSPVTGSLVRGADHRWRVSDIHYPGGRC